MVFGQSSSIPAIPQVTSERDVDGASPHHITVRKLACDIRTRSQRRKRDDSAHVSHGCTHTDNRERPRLRVSFGYGYSRYIPQSHAPSDLLGESASPCWNGALMGEHDGP